MPNPRSKPYCQGWSHKRSSDHMKQTNASSKKDAPKPAMPKPQPAEGPVRRNVAAKAEEVKQLLRNIETASETECAAEAILLKRRAELLEDKLTDKEIASALSKELSRSQDSIYARLRRLVASRKIVENPNKRQLRFTKEQLSIIIRRRSELISEGLHDKEISRILAKEIGRPAEAIYHRITVRRRRLAGLEENPNIRRPEFTPDEIDLLSRRRAELIQTGFTDAEIGRCLCGELKRPSSGIEGKMHNLVRSGHLAANPNKKDRMHFSDSEIQTILEERRRYEGEGLVDTHIARRLAEKLERNADVIFAKITEFVKSGRLSRNRNQGVKFDDETTELIIKRREEMMRQGMTDKSIGEELSKQLSKSPRSVKSRIERLIKRGRLQRNTNSNRSFDERDINRMKTRRQELMGKGLNDSQISRTLAGELDRSERSIDGKIEELIGGGEMAANPNKRRSLPFSEGEESRLISRRKELIQVGLHDKAISGVLASELKGHSSQAFAHKIRILLESKRIEPNPNRGFRFRDTTIVKIVSMHNELAVKGLSDKEISAAVAKELGDEKKWNTILAKIKKLVQDGVLIENKNVSAHSAFSDSEDSVLFSRFDGLVKEGLPDVEIAAQFAKTLGRPQGSIRNRMKHLRMKGRLQANPNNMTKFSPEETAILRSKRAELIAQGYTDRRISSVLAGILNRPAGSIDQKMRDLVKAGLLKCNPNKRDAAIFTAAEVDTIITVRNELLKEGRTDGAISKTLAKRMPGRHHGTIRYKIVSLVEEGRLAKNSNARTISEFLDEEIDLIKARRSELMRRGFDDGKIAKRLSTEMRARSMETVSKKIQHMVRRGALEANPNNPSSKPKHYWKDVGNFDKELNLEIAREYRDREGNVFKEQGEFPSFNQLLKAGRSDLASAFKHHGGARKVRTRLGYGQYRVEDGYWESWENVERDVRAEIAKEYRDKQGGIGKRVGEFPNSRQLCDAGKSSIAYAIITFHGGFSAVRERIGLADDGAGEAKQQIEALLEKLEGKQD